MLRAAIVGGVILTLAVSAAQAQSNSDKEGLKGGTPAPEIEAKEWINTDGEKLSLSDLRGLVVVIYFWSSLQRDRSIEANFELMNYIDSAAQYNGIFVLGVTEADRFTVEKALQKQKVFYPIALGSVNHKDYKIETFPSTVIVSPSGKVAWTGRPGALLSEQTFREAEKAALDEAPTKTHPRLAKVANTNLEEARANLLRKDYRDAWRLARIATENALIGDLLKTRCQSMVDLVEALGRDKLERGQVLIDTKNYSEGIALFGEVLRDYNGSAPARLAKKRLESLSKKFPEVQKVLDRQHTDQQARQKLSEAISSLKEKDIGEAFELLEDIVKSSPDAEAADDARKILGRMRKDEGLMGHVRDYQSRGECEVLMSKAKGFETTKQYDRAREVYQDILKRFADTRYADDAAERLANLP